MSGCCGKRRGGDKIPPNELVEIEYLGDNPTVHMYKGMYGARYYFRKGRNGQKAIYPVRGVDASTYIDKHPSLFKLPDDNYPEVPEVVDEMEAMEEASVDEVQPLMDSVEIDGLDISPTALDMIKNHNLNISGIVGTGKNNRILKRDIEHLVGD